MLTYMKPLISSQISLAKNCVVSQKTICFSTGLRPEFNSVDRLLVTMHKVGIKIAAN